MSVVLFANLLQSIETRVETGVSLLDLQLLVVLRHFRKRISICVQLSTNIIPPHGEVLL